MLTIKTILQSTPVIPVISLEDTTHAVAIAQALYEGGIKVIEVTLRTKAALAVISAMTEALPQCQIGAGTIIEPSQLAKARAAGASFAVSPGLSSTIAHEAKAQDMPYLPGVCTPSEILTARELGFHELKFFPAKLAGGPNALKQYGAVFQDICFCPTGGITADTMPDYLELENVICVGGSWLVPKQLIEQQNWSAMTELAKIACQLK